MKINFISSGDKEGKRGSTRIRVLNLIKALTGKGIHCAFNDENVQGYDLIVFQKTPLTKDMKKIIQQARCLKIPIVYDLDDYSLGIMRQLKYYDLVMVSTPYLADICRAYHPNVTVIPNSLDVDDISIPLKTNNVHKSVVWYGYSQNAYILDKWNIRGIKRISNGKKDIPYQADRIDSQLQEHDLVVIPQEENENTLSKTHCRMLKAVYLGIPCLVSNMPVYVELAKLLNFPSEFIVSSPEEWNLKIQDFKKNNLKFNFDFETARQTILKNFSADKIAEIFLKNIEPLLKKEPHPLALVRDKGSNPLVSVIISLSSDEGKTRKTLDAVINQTLFDMEIILVGDKDTENLYTDYLKKDKRILLTRDPQYGITPFRIRNVKGTYVYFLQAGEWIAHRALKQLYIAAEISEAEIISTQGFICERNAISCKRNIFSDEKCLHLIKDMSSVPEFTSLNTLSGTTFYRRDFLIKNHIWQPDFRLLPEKEFIYRAWSQCRLLYVIPEFFIHCDEKYLCDKGSSSPISIKSHINALTQIHASDKKKNDILLLLKNQIEIPQLFVTVSSLINHLQTKATIHIFSQETMPEETKLKFETLSTSDISVLITLIPRQRFKNERNILFHILNGWCGSKKVLYVSNNCLAISNLDALFRIPLGEKLLCCRRNDHKSTLDKNVILFYIPRWKKVCRDIPYLTKEISDSMWNDLFYSLSVPLSPAFNYFSSEFQNLSPATISEIKILTYDSRKPWKNLTMPLGYLWWQRARNTFFYEEILLQNKQDQLTSSRIGNEILERAGDDKEHLLPIMTAYIKESLFYLFTFGSRAKRHKDILIQLREQLLDEVGR